MRHSCVTCYECTRDDNVTALCDVDDKCFIVKMQKTKSSNVTVTKGCSSLLPYVGSKLNCDYKCSNKVELFGSHKEKYHSVCVSCCSGNSCNYHPHQRNTQPPSTQPTMPALIHIVYFLIWQCSSLLISD